MKIETTTELALHGLRSLYNAEKQLTKALPKVIEAVSDVELAASVEEHLRETETQVERLETIFNLLDEDAKGVESQVMDEMIDHAEWLASHVEEGPLRDSALIAASRKVEHFEIISYEIAIAEAQLVGFPQEAIDLLELSLEEEEAADAKLFSQAPTIAEGAETEVAAA